MNLILTTLWYFNHDFFFKIILDYSLPELNGLSHEILGLFFLAFMDASRPECEPLLVLKLL
jgi:hypothetical protein